MLIVFGGLPGTGKTTLAQALAEKLGAAYLRIDTIEHTLAPAEDTRLGDEGYRVAYALAEDNLKLGHTVIADSVNPIAITREAWRAVGERAGVKTVEIEIICSDTSEHRRRVETRKTDVDGLVLPTWEEVQSREYHEWTRPHIVVDTAGKTIERSLAELETALGRGG